MDTFITNFLAGNYGIIISVIVGILYSVTHRTAAFAYAKRKAATFMFAAEKHAEQLVLTTGASRLAWVVDLTYNVLPAAVRIIVSKPALTTAVQALFDDAIKLAGSHGVAVTPTDVVPVVAPVVGSPVTVSTDIPV